MTLVHQNSDNHPSLHEMTDSGTEESSIHKYLRSPWLIQLFGMAGKRRVRMKLRKKKRMQYSKANI